MKSLLYVRHCARPWEDKRRATSSLKDSGVCLSQPTALELLLQFLRYFIAFYQSLLNKRCLTLYSFNLPYILDSLPGQE